MVLRVLKRKTRPNRVMFEMKLLLMMMMFVVDMVVWYTGQAWLLLLLLIAKDLLVVHIGHGWIPSGGSEFINVVDIHGKKSIKGEYIKKEEEEEYLLCFFCVIMKIFFSYLLKPFNQKL